MLGFDEKLQLYPLVASVRSKSKRGVVLDRRGSKLYACGI